MRPVRATTTDTSTWLPLEDRRDADGYTYAEHCDNVARVAAGQAPRPPIHPRVTTPPPVEPTPTPAPQQPTAKPAPAIAPRQRIKFLDDYKRKPRPKTRKRRIDKGAVYFTADDGVNVRVPQPWQRPDRGR